MLNATLFASFCTHVHSPHDAMQPEGQQSQSVVWERAPGDTNKPLGIHSYLVLSRLVSSPTAYQEQKTRSTMETSLFRSGLRDMHHGLFMSGCQVHFGCAWLVLLKQREGQNCKKKGLLDFDSDTDLVICDDRFILSNPFHPTWAQRRARWSSLDSYKLRTQRFQRRHYHTQTPLPSTELAVCLQCQPPCVTPSPVISWLMSSDCDATAASIRDFFGLRFNCSISANAVLLDSSCFPSSVLSDSLDLGPSCLRTGHQAIFLHRSKRGEIKSICNGLDAPKP